MKLNCFIAGLCLIAGISLSSCGGSEGSSSSKGCFGAIPQKIDSYKQKSDEIKSGLNEKNYEKKYKEDMDLKNKTAAEVEALAKELDGKELTCTVDEQTLKIVQPVKIKFDQMNNLYPWFKFDTEIVAANDLVLKADPSRLKQASVFKDQEIRPVKMPVSLEYLDKDGNVVKEVKSVGSFTAENDGTTAVIKSGTPLNIEHTIAVNSDMIGAESIRFVIDLDKEPYIL